jgi:metallophosphoesterase superfamily enzyme
VGLYVGDAWLLHGHTWPHPEALERDLIIIGHTHPVLRLFEDEAAVRQRVYPLARTRKARLYEALLTRRGYGELVKSYSMKGAMRLLVMPHFNQAARAVEVGQLVNSKMGSPLFRYPSDKQQLS